MIDLVSGLFVSFCILVTLTYLCSLTFTERDTRVLRALRYVLAGGGGIALMWFTVPLFKGVIVDLRLVPVAIAALLGGFRPGLLVAVPIAAYRVYLGGPGTYGGLMNLLITLLLATALHVHARRRGAPTSAWWTPLLIAGAADLTLLLTPKGVQTLQAAYVPLVIAHAAGIAVGLAVLQQRLQTLRQATTLQKLAFRDPLTGAGNRRQLTEDCAGTPVGGTYLLALDLDHFKHVNDAHGHPFGDRVLVELTGLLRSLLRERDGVYRTGGEEFVVVLRDCQTGIEARVAERLCRAVATTLAARAGKPELHLTISIGLAPYTGDLEASLALADERLYEAKAAGRNRVCSEPWAAAHATPA